VAGASHPGAHNQPRLGRSDGDVFTEGAWEVPLIRDSLERIRSVESEVSFGFPVGEVLGVSLGSSGQENVRPDWSYPCVSSDLIDFLQELLGWVLQTSACVEGENTPRKEDARSESDPEGKP
jgi:hypothetical protein